MIERIVWEAEEAKIEYLERRRKLKNANQNPKRSIKSNFK